MLPFLFIQINVHELTNSKHEPTYQLRPKGISTNSVFDCLQNILPARKVRDQAKTKATGMLKSICRGVERTVGFHLASIRNVRRRVETCTHWSTLPRKYDASPIGQSCFRRHGGFVTQKRQLCRCKRCSAEIWYQVYYEGSCIKFRRLSERA
jgi:hypothetical protein